MEGRLTGLVTSCLLKHAVGGRIEGEVTGRRERSRKQLLNNPTEKRRYWKLKEKHKITLGVEQRNKRVSDCLSQQEMSQHAVYGQRIHVSSPETYIHMCICSTRWGCLRHAFTWKTDAFSTMTQKINLN